MTRNLPNLFVSENSHPREVSGTESRNTNFRFLHLKGSMALVGLLILPVLLVLGGCAGQGQLIQNDDTTGDLGTDKRESPAALYVQMGIAYLREGQTAIALQKLKKAISIDPQNAQAYNVTGILYERLGKMDLADEHYAKAVELKPRDPYIRNARGSFFCKQGEYEKAQIEFEQALSNPLYSTPWVAMTNAGLCAERAGDVNEAEGQYRRALTSNDNYFQALYQMAKLSFARKDFLSARGYLERYNAVAQSSAVSLWLGVQIERNLGDLNKAREYGSELMAKFPDAPEVQLLRQSGW